MKASMRVWLRASWHWPRRGLDEDGWRLRERLIRDLAPDRSLVDVGGMWGVNGRAAFLAEEAGAKRVTLFDAMSPTAEFEAERDRRSSEVEYTHGDLNNPGAVTALGVFDIVWCTGVLYHTPHPLLQLENLRRITAERLVLGTRVIPEVPGLEQACLLYPGQSAAAQREFARAIRDDLPRIGWTSPFDANQPDANWWWGMSPSAVRAMVEVVGFRVLEEYGSTPFMRHLVATPA